MLGVSARDGSRFLPASVSLCVFNGPFFWYVIFLIFLLGELCAGSKLACVMHHVVSAPSLFFLNFHTFSF